MLLLVAREALETVEERVQAHSQWQQLAIIHAHTGVEVATRESGVDLLDVADAIGQAPALELDLARLRDDAVVELRQLVGARRPHQGAPHAIDAQPRHHGGENLERDRHNDDIVG